MSKRIGLVVGDEPAFVEAMQRRCAAHPDVECDLALIGRTGERHISHYDVLVDRFSPWVPHYRANLRASVLAGVTVINDPFAVAPDDAFFGLSLAAHLGAAVPRSVLLPQHSYDSSIDTERCLRNLEYPVSWHALVDYVRLPCVMRSASRPERVAPVLVRDLEQVWRAFDRIGENVVMLQQHLPSAAYLRALCVADGPVLLRGIDGEPAPLDEPHRQLAGSLAVEATAVPETVCGEVRRVARELCAALGYELGSVDFAVRQGVPYVLAGPEPVPPLDPEVLSQQGFDELLDGLAALAVAFARGKRRSGPPPRFVPTLERKRGQP